MRDRLEIQTLFESVCDNVYYQTPIKLKFPCIKYSFSDLNITGANNQIYLAPIKYEITLITETPITDDTHLYFKILDLPLGIRPTQPMFVKDNLYHWVFTLYY